MSMAPPATDVPVLIETPSRHGQPLVRCIYMSVEMSEPSPGWEITLDGQTMPFLMLGLAGIVLQPFSAPRFDSYAVIEDFFTRLESRKELLLVFQDLWLPPFLLPHEVQLGAVYRLRLDLFRDAHRFRESGMMLSEFESVCQEHMNALFESPEEARAFSGWIAEQVGMATETPKSSQLAMRLKHP